MFIDRLQAMSNLIDYVNSVLIIKPITRQYDLTTLNSAEEQPSLKLGEYDLAITTEEDLNYIVHPELNGITKMLELILICLDYG